MCCFIDVHNSAVKAGPKCEKPSHTVKRSQVFNLQCMPPCLSFQCLSFESLVPLFSNQKTQVFNFVQIPPEVLYP